MQGRLMREGCLAIPIWVRILALTAGETFDDFRFALATEGLQRFNSALRVVTGLSNERGKDKAGEFSLGCCVSFFGRLLFARLQPQVVSASLMKRDGCAGHGQLFGQGLVFVFSVLEGLDDFFREAFLDEFSQPSQFISQIHLSRNFAGDRQSQMLAHNDCLPLQLQLVK